MPDNSAREKIYRDALPWNRRERNLEYVKQFEPDSRQTETEAAAIIKATGIKPGDSVIDLCCGAGRHLVRLGTLGMNVTGVDIGPGFVEVAKRRLNEANISGHVIEADVNNFVPSDRFDLVTIMNNTFGLFEHGGNRLLLRKAYDLLKDGGYLFFDVGNREFTLKEILPRKTWWETDGKTYLEHSLFDVETGRWNSITIEMAVNAKQRYVHSKRLYTYNELRMYLWEAGFTDIRAYGDFDFSEYHHRSRKLIVVAQRSPNPSALEKDISIECEAIHVTPEASTAEGMPEGRFEEGTPAVNAANILPYVYPCAGLPSRWFIISRKESQALARIEVAFDRRQRLMILSSIQLCEDTAPPQVGKALEYLFQKLSHDDIYERIVLEVARSDGWAVTLATQAGLSVVGTFRGATQSVPFDERNESSENWVHISGSSYPIGVVMERFLLD